MHYAAREGPKTTRGLDRSEALLRERAAIAVVLFLLYFATLLTALFFGEGLMDIL